MLPFVGIIIDPNHTWTTFNVLATCTKTKRIEENGWTVVHVCIQVRTIDETRRVFTGPSPQFSAVGAVLRKQKAFIYCFVPSVALRQNAAPGENSLTPPRIVRILREYRARP